MSRKEYIFAKTAAASDFILPKMYFEDIKIKENVSCPLNLT